MLAALDGEIDPTLIAAQLPPPLTRFTGERIELLVGMHRVVMEEKRALGARAPGEGEGMRKRGVTPAEVVGILGVGVLAVVDQQRGVAGQAEA